MANDPTKATPGFQVVAALAAHGKMDRAALQAKTSLDDRQVGNALYRAKTLGQVTRDDKGIWHITKAGREWLTGGGKFRRTAKPAPKTSPATVKTARRMKPRKGKDLAPHEQQRAGVVEVTAKGDPTRSTRPAEATPSPRTRFAIFNDGHFFITKNGIEIDLEPDEHKDLLKYLDRLAEPLAPHA